MTLKHSMAASLHGAMMLARGQARGILLIEMGPRGVARSFWALAWALPSVLYIATQDWSFGAPPPQALMQLARHTAVFVVAWLAFAALSHRLAPRFARAHLWPQMIASWNWCGVPENMLLMLGTVPGALGAPHVVDQAAQVATFGWALWIERFALRLAFGAGPLLAAWFVMVDQTIGLILSILSHILTRT